VMYPNVADSLTAYAVTDDGHADDGSLLLAVAEAEPFLVAAARAMGIPLQYLLGEAVFCGVQFALAPGVFIPRPETEHLVSTVLELVREIEAPRILDVGTGCGAIAIALAHSRPEASVFASDVSVDALEVAEQNASRLLPSHESPLRFFPSDLLNDVPWPTLNLDVVVANLPYIGTQEFHFVEATVDRYEPSVALYGGVDGLRLYDRLFEQINCSSDAAALPRWILGEFGCFQRERLEAMIQRHFPSAAVSFHSDLAGLDRFFVLALRP